VFHIGGAFALQYAIGFIIDRWPGHDGHYPLVAYKMALAVVLVLQFLALAWFVRPARRTRDARPDSAGTFVATGATAPPDIETVTSSSRIWTAAQQSRSRYLWSRLLSRLLGKAHDNAVEATKPPEHMPSDSLATDKQQQHDR
jgi:hypothetical protein